MSSLVVCETNPLSGAALLDGFCAGVLPVSVQQARSIVSTGGPTDFLTLERGTGSVLVLEDLDGDGMPESMRTLVTVDGLNHGLAITTTHLYASTPTQVFRWPYDPTSKTVADPQELVIENMNADGNGGAPFGHTTRTLVVDEPNNRLYVSVGSNENIDPNSFRSRIRVFDIGAASLFPIDFLTGTVFADGLRNEVAMEFRPHDNVLWGAGNSADRLDRQDLGGSDIYNDNPAEELHRFDMSGGQNYGYPYCFREYELGEAGLGKGTAWAWPTFLDSFTDQMCRENYDAPILAMQAHSAPLGITFYQYSSATSKPTECQGVEPFPESMDGDAFIAFHGSWNREIPTGYKVVHVPVTEDGTGVVGGIGADPIDFLYAEGESAQWDDGFRPVDVSFDACGRLLVSSDGSQDDGYLGSKIVRIQRTPQDEPVGPTIAPSRTPIESTEPPSTTSPTIAPALVASSSPRFMASGLPTTQQSTEPTETASGAPTLSLVPTPIASAAPSSAGSVPPTLPLSDGAPPTDEGSAAPTASIPPSSDPASEGESPASTETLNDTSGAAIPTNLFWSFMRSLSILMFLLSAVAKW